MCGTSPAQGMQKGVGVSAARTGGCSAVVTPAVTGLAHLHGLKCCSVHELLPQDPEAACLLRPGAEPFLRTHYRVPTLQRARSIPQRDVWCSADIPLKVPGERSHTGAVGLINVERRSLKFSTGENPPLSKHQDFPSSASNLLLNRVCATTREGHRWVSCPVHHALPPVLQTLEKIE